MSALAYQPRPTNGRLRRTKAEVLTLREAIYNACAAHQPLTVRNLFYLLVSAGIVEKIEPRSYTGLEDLLERYYIGDFDPSGVVARNDVERRLERYLQQWIPRFTDSFDFVSLAVTAEQIDLLDLPTKPPKTSRNTHARSLGWGSDLGTVEAEAMDPDQLRALLRVAIEDHLPEGELERLRTIEQEERRTLERLRFELAEEQRA